MPSKSEITVRYCETDCMGVVHHSVYPVWFEIARTDYISKTGMSYSEMEKNGVMLPVTGISCKYIRPARYGDIVTVETKITRLTLARIEFSYIVTKKDDSEILTTGTSAHGFVDSKTFRPLNLKKFMPELYANIESEFFKDKDTL